jgi:hypothetical protein
MSTNDFIFDPSYFDETPTLAESSDEQSAALIPVDLPVSDGISSRGRQQTLSRTMQQSIAQKDFYGKRCMHYIAASTTESSDITFDDEDAFHDWHLELQDRMTDPIAFHAEMMGDIMYLHQVLRQPDASEFVKAIIKEVNGHVENKNWLLICRDQVPPDIEVVPSVWALRRKRNLITNEITKCKARLNLHGGKQVYGINYYETYAPVVTWFAIQLLLIIALILGLGLGHEINKMQSVRIWAAHVVAALVARIMQRRITTALAARKVEHVHNFPTNVRHGIGTLICQLNVTGTHAIELLVSIHSYSSRVFHVPILWSASAPHRKIDNLLCTPIISTRLLNPFFPH